MRILVAGALTLQWTLGASAEQAAPAAAAAAAATSTAATRAPDTIVVPREALALLRDFDADLRSHDSATLMLEHWCEEHRLASPARIVAERVLGVDKLPSAAQRRELAVPADEPVRYRRVRLKCGAVVLSEADNWYVPGRLTPSMNDLLDHTDTPFGKVVQSLQFQRHTLAVTRLWETQAAADHERGNVVTLPTELLRHRALLTLPDGTPVSEVVETYESGVLAFAIP